MGQDGKRLSVAQGDALSKDGLKGKQWKQANDKGHSQAWQWKVSLLLSHESKSERA